MSRAAMTGMSLKISGVSQHDFQHLINFFGITEKRAQLAYRRAVDKTMTWLKREASKDISGQTGIPMKVLRKRLQAYRTSKALMRGKVWFGLNALDADYISSGRQIKAGVKVGRHFFPGAFKASIYSSKQKIWIRKSSKHFDPNMYPSRRGRATGGVVNDESRGRFPVVKVRVDIEEAEDIFVNWIAKAESYLARLINKELNIEIQRAARA